MRDAVYFLIPVAGSALAALNGLVIIPWFTNRMTRDYTATVDGRVLKFKFPPGTSDALVSAEIGKAITEMRAANAQPH